MIVNTDADNQYYGGDIEKLVAPILAGHADMVIGDRDLAGHSDSRRARSACSASAPGRAARVGTTVRTPLGFRAYNRSALQIMVVSSFTYTLESIIQAGKQLVAIDPRADPHEPEDAESRLFTSVGGYVRRSAVSIFRIYSQYEPLRVFLSIAALLGLARPRYGSLRRCLRRGQGAAAMSSR